MLMEIGHNIAVLVTLQIIIGSTIPLSPSMGLANTLSSGLVPLASFSNVVIVNSHDELSGSGRGLIKCPVTGREFQGSISFIAFKRNGPVFGSWEIIADHMSATPRNNVGSLNGGTLANREYRVTGSVISDLICNNPSNNPNTSAHITGSCGQDVAIRLRTESGESGIFNGEVSCSSALSTSATAGSEGPSASASASVSVESK
jgi:hypothetical protein